MIFFLYETIVFFKYNCILKISKDINTTYTYYFMIQLDNLFLKLFVIFFYHLDYVHKKI